MGTSLGFLIDESSLLVFAKSCRKHHQRPSASVKFSVKSKNVRNELCCGKNTQRKKCPKALSNRNLPLSLCPEEKYVDFKNLELMLSNAYLAQEINKVKRYTAFTSLGSQVSAGTQCSLVLSRTWRLGVRVKARFPDSQSGHTNNLCCSFLLRLLF